MLAGGDFMNNSKDTEVICHFRIDGSIAPIKVKVVDEDGFTQVFAIKRYKLPKQTLQSQFSYQGRLSNDTVYMDYDCFINVFGTNKLIRLRYFVSEHKWKIIE